MKINFFYEDTPEFRLVKKSFRNWIVAAIKEEAKEPGDLNFIFCSDGYLLGINKQYLEHDYYTDVITFDYSAEFIISGDIFISVDRVKENACIFGVLFMEELSRVIIHGILHLIGYTDKEPEDKRVMTERENYYLAHKCEF